VTRCSPPCGAGKLPGLPHRRVRLGRAWAHLAKGWLQVVHGHLVLPLLAREAKPGIMLQA